MGKLIKMVFVTLDHSPEANILALKERWEGMMTLESYAEFAENI